MGIKVKPIVIYGSTPTCATRLPRYPPKSTPWIASVRRPRIGRGTPLLSPPRAPHPQSKTPCPQSRTPCPQSRTPCLQEGSGVACTRSGLSVKGIRADGAEGSVSTSISSICPPSQSDRSEGRAGMRAPPPLLPPLPEGRASPVEVHPVGVPLVPKAACQG